MKVGLFYASDWGHTEKIAKFIVDEIGDDDVVLKDLALDNIEDAEVFEHLIFGVPTSEDHLPQLDWKRAIPKLDSIDLDGKSVALFGLGDQKEYPDNFADSLGDLFDKVVERGANVVGDWWDDNYQFKKSKAFRGGSFVGLVLDEDNQDDLSEDRIRKWLKQIYNEF